MSLSKACTVEAWLLRGMDEGNNWIIIALTLSVDHSTGKLIFMASLRSEGNTRRGLGEQSGSRVADLVD